MKFKNVGQKVLAGAILASVAIQIYDRVDLWLVRRKFAREDAEWEREHQEKYAHLDA